MKMEMKRQMEMKMKRQNEKRAKRLSVGLSATPTG